jgi:hypothetical protein
MARHGKRKTNYEEQADGSRDENYDPFDETQSPNMRPIESGEAMDAKEALRAIAGAGGEVGMDTGGGASQPLDLTQLVMMLSMRMGMSRLSDELIYTLFFGLLGTSVDEQALFDDTNELPTEMSYGEAQDRMKREMAGTRFPLVMSLIAEREGRVDDMIQRDYFKKLVNKNILIMRNLKKQGILNWGQVAMGSNMELMPMDDENFQLINTMNPVYRKFVTTGEV